MLPTMSRNKPDDIGDTAMIMRAEKERTKRVTNVLLVSSDSVRRNEIARKLSWVDKLDFSDSVGELFTHLKLSKRFDTIITELTISDAFGFLVIPRIQEVFPTAPIIVIHHAFDEDTAAMCFHYGACDFLAPTMSVSEKSFERAVKLANLRSKFGPKSRNWLSRLDILSSRAREIACGAKRESSTRVEQIEDRVGIAESAT